VAFAQTGGSIGGYDFRGILSTFARMALASVVGGAIAWTVTIPLGVLGGVSGSLAQVVIGGVAGLAVSLWLARLLGVREVSSALRMVSRAVTRKRSA
jgi:hypothetical protein